MKIIIAGGRNFHNLDIMDKILSENVTSEDSIISGDAKGADTLGIIWAQKHKVPVHHFPAKWIQQGKSAGFIRNAVMADYADVAIIFWDGKSKGTEHMIKTMKKKNKPCWVYDYDGKPIE